MKILLTLSFVSAFLIPAFAQTTIQGTVRDVMNEPVPGANIFLKDSYDGTTSRLDGSFSFSSSIEGAATLIVKFVGFREFGQVLTLEGKSVTVEIILREEINELEAVTISAGAFTASDQARRTIFSPVDIATTAGATADIAGALNTLPGTQKVGESGRLFVRGGDGSETRTFIDGLVVLDAYSPSSPNTPSRGRFLPFMFKGTSFSTGGYSAEFGQALSSALVLDSKDESEITRTDIGILSVGGDVAHTQAWNSGSAAAKIQYTNIRPYFGLINQEIDWKTAPASIEGVGAFRQKTGNDGMLKVYGKFSDSDFSLYQHDIDDYGKTTYYRLKNSYRYVNASHKAIMRKDWTIRSGLSFSSIRNNSSIGSSGINEIERGLHAKTVVEGSVTNSIELKAGVELLHRRFDERYQQDYGYSFDEWLPSFFVETDLYASNRFVSRVGARSEFNSLTSKFSVDPRISLAYKFDNSAQLSFAFGRFRQTAPNEYIRLRETLNSERAEHYILNYQLIRNRRTFRIEGFYKQYNSLVKFGPENNLNNDGHGYAKGIELFWRDNETLRAFDYWVSYSFLDTRRDYLNYPRMATPSFASAHNFSLVAKYFFKSLKTQLGATYSFSSGRPYNNPNEASFNAARTPVYQDLSLNVSYLPKPNLIIYVSCTNLPGYDNIFGYEYSTVQNEAGLYNARAIRQPAPRFLFVGVFITLSKSKSLNLLPTL